MKPRGQQQEAGNNSQQWQVSGNVIVHQNMDPERAQELMRRIAQEEMARYGAESQEIANARIDQLELRVMEALGEAKALGGLADPSVQVALRKAQIGAASTEREDDYEILAGLIRERVVNGGARTVRAGINLAIEIVDLLDADALRGMTLLHVASTLTPRGLTPQQGIATMSAIVGDIINDGPLPVGDAWLDHLDILGAIRFNPVKSFKSFDDYWPGLTPGYVTMGVPTDDPMPEIELPLEAREVLEKALLIDHCYRPGFKRIAASNTQNLGSLLRAAEWNDDDTVSRMIDAATEHFHLGDIDPESSAAYMRDVRADPNLGKLANWWDELSVYCTITMAGRVLARSNARRLHPAVPRLDAV